MSESELAQEYASELKTTTLADIRIEWAKIKAMSLDELNALTGRSKLGCNIVDHYFFAERLITVGKKLINFLDFVENIEYYKTKKYIQTLLTFCEKNNRYTDSILKRYYYIYGLCFGRVNAFKITNAYAIYKRYNPTRVLDPFAGFGGRMIGAMMANIKYRGYDLNKYMEASYAQLLDDFSSDGRTNVSISFCDSSLINYEEVARTYPYDMILTSPPYRNIELYRLSEKHSNDWWHDFYVRIFTSLWAGLATNGYMVVNINDEIYQESLVPFFGECREKVLLTKTKKNSYDEYIYTWIKC